VLRGNKNREKPLLVLDLTLLKEIKVTQ